MDPATSRNDGSRGRLPTLTEVLMRKTKPPLDLYCFYIFLQQENAEDALDFWLDVQQHENLCRAYLKDLRNHNRSVQTEWPAYAEYARHHGSIFSHLAGMQEGFEAKGDLIEPRYLDATEEDEFGLDHDSGRDHGQDQGRGGHENNYSSEKMSSEVGRAFGGGSGDHDNHGENGRVGTIRPVSGPDQRNLQHTPPPNEPYFPNPHQTPLQASYMAGNPSHLTNRSPGKKSLRSGKTEISGSDGSNTHLVETDQEKRRVTSRLSRALGRGQVGGPNGNRRLSRAPTVIPRNQAITQDDIRESGERIFATYLVSGAEKEVYLPSSIRIHDFPSQTYEGAPTDPAIPDYFHQQKNHIFKALEEDAFVRFLRGKAFSNLTKLSSYLRLFLGLFCLWAGLWAAFTLVFLDIKPKIKRLYLIIPFFFSFYFLFSAYYSISPLLILFNRSETQPFRLIKMGESYVAKVLQGRALVATLFAVIATAIMVVIWWAVPGKRL